MLFSIDFLVVDIGFRVGCVVSISTNMNIFYHRNFPRSLVIFSWKLLSGCIFTFLFLLSFGAATHNVGFLCAAAVLIGVEKNESSPMQPGRQGNHGDAVDHPPTFACGVLGLLIQLPLPITHPRQWHPQDQDLLQKIGNIFPLFLFQWLRSSRAPENVSII